MYAYIGPPTIPVGRVYSKGHAAVALPKIPTIGCELYRVGVRVRLWPRVLHDDDIRVRGRGRGRLRLRG